MKTILTILFCVSYVSIFSADLFVRENGANGAYSSINDAILSAANGDRILIKNKAGSVSYKEDLTINKSLQLISEIDGESFTLEGDVSVVPSSGLEVSIINMKNESGSIYANQNLVSGSQRCNVKILNCELVSGDVLFGFDNFDLTLANTIINGLIQLRYGRILGCTIDDKVDDEVIYISSENSSFSTSNDHIDIIGNRITSNHNQEAIFCGSSDFNYNIYNNFITFRQYGIYFSVSKSGKNFVHNNTFNQVWHNSTTYACYLTSNTANAEFSIYSNVFDAYPNTSTQHGIYSSGSTLMIEASYNYFNSDFDYTVYPTGFNNNTNLSNAVFSFSSTTGEVTSGTPINGGHPDSIYYDIDLTRNDGGCYGGSYTMENYFPSNNSGAGNPRIYFLDIPRRISVGNTIDVKAGAYDK